MADLVIASRASSLAIKQVEILQGLLPAASQIRTITTEGDKLLDKKLMDFGGKGLFTKEIDGAVLNGTAHMAVHSLKDMETELPAGLTIGAVLARGDVRDAVVSANYTGLGELPEGAVVGTSSLRRQAQVLHYYPHLRVQSVRGNVETRLKKLQTGDYDALLLAVAGLHRLGLQEEITKVLSAEELLPAVGQGALAVTCRADDAAALSLLQGINHGETAHAVMAERAFLRQLDGSCRTPIAALAEVSGDAVALQGLLAAEDGGRLVRKSCATTIAEAEKDARLLADTIRKEFGDG